jgi:O-antigen ligase
MLYLMLGYVYLCIHRPFEIWPALGELRIELAYFSIMTVCWLVVSKRIRGYALLAAILGMGAAFALSWAMSQWSEKAEAVVKNYAMIFGFAVMVATTVRDTRGLRLLVVAFLGVLALYMLHSLREYVGGRHVFRMGIARLVGVDSSLNDPNSFGGSVVYALPFAMYLWEVWPTVWQRAAIGCYVLLSVGCVALTGSRSALLGVVACGLLFAAGVRHKLLWLALLSLVGAASFLALPESLQDRFHTIIDPSVGPANAQESGKGRVEGFFIGLDLWSAYPVAGCGPGAWRPATGRKIESHNLYGQLVGELGTVGLVAFAFMVAALFWNLRTLRRMSRPANGATPDAGLFRLAQAMTASTLLLLFQGVFSHNLYRFNWFWYCAFTAVGVAICKARAADRAEQPADDASSDYEEDLEEWDYSTASAAG